LFVVMTSVNSIVLFVILIGDVTVFINCTSLVSFLILVILHCHA